MNCLIVDADTMSRSSLEFICSRIQGVETTTVGSALDASRALNQQNFDLIFLDIDMPEFNGLDLIRFSKRMPPIILTSAQSNYAFDAFQFEAVDYLAKPLTLPRVSKAITKANALSELSSNNTVQPVGDSSVYIRVDGKHVKLDFNEIFVIESMRDYVMFRTENCRYVVHSTLKNIEERLGHDQRFLKIHRSFIINTDTITDYDDRSVVCGPYTVPVSRSNRTLLQKHLNSY